MVPDGWKNTHLIELVEGQIKNGYSPNATDHITGYWVLGLGALGEDGFNDEAIKPVEPTEKVLGNLLACNDFLVSRSNTPDKVGRAVRYKGELSNCSYPDLMMRFRVDPKKADLDYVEQKIRSSSTRNYYKSRAAGSSSTMVKINKSVVAKTPIQLPPLPEQKKISKILLAWDRAIEGTDKLLSNSQKQKKSLMQQLLTGKKRLQGFNDEWEEIRLKSLLQEEKARNKDSSIQRVLSVTNHSGFVLPEEQFSKRVASSNVSNYKIVKRGEFAYNPSRINVGSFARLENHDEGILSPMYVVFSVKEEFIFSDFFFQWMSSHHAKQRILSSAQGSVRDSVSFQALCAFPFSLPSLKEQQKIASVLSSADKEIETLQQKLELLKQEKKALMQQLLTGKRRVKIDEEGISQKETVHD